MITGDLEYVMSSLPDLYFQNSEEDRNRVYSLLRKYSGLGEDEVDMVQILDDEAQKYLDSSSFDLFRQINLKDIHSESFQKSGISVLSGFSIYMNDLKNGIRDLRLSRKGEELGSTSKKDVLPLNPGNPLEEEVQLLKWQWDKLEELSSGHYTSFSAIAAYKLKLLLLLRWWSFDEEKGFVNYINLTKED